jgi:hypothetical protein
MEINDIEDVYSRLGDLYNDLEQMKKHPHLFVKEIPRAKAKIARLEDLIDKASKQSL